MIGFPVVDCKMCPGGMLYQCACNIAFKCGSTTSATSRHCHDHDDMTEIPFKVTLNSHSKWIFLMYAMPISLDVCHIHIIHSSTLNRSFYSSMEIKTFHFYKISDAIFRLAWPTNIQILSKYYDYVHSYILMVIFRSSRTSHK